ncbi:hypothetical protein [Acetobacterium woodii]|uniref:Uncharacterized protein n=1 Tax=Acetobacterium woodii (strain ATCC 29683 / DSM 1030 / JCM 2381 / KCTC 1655 / WB1) TaxID=931626 RepID=H6LFS0_ACEWD|nr:hypothetical protein [Acetobacterium woodii]AFA47015.1 hypothetical protein Awo_c02060 [Acetobacterium woodii DSM 1030]
MKIRIKEVVKNQNGSSLAFVLIIGMIIMVMSLSLLAVANSDFTFTQQTVESRQAYIDAKSVIEYGKVEINKRVTNLEEKNKDLMALYETYKTEAEKSNPNTITLTQLEKDIASAKDLRSKAETKLNDTYVIYGNPGNITETLTAVAPDPLIEKNIVKLGELKFYSANYQFKIETDSQNLSRKLDYQVSFNYQPSDVSETVIPGTSPVTPDKPTYLEYGDVYGKWRLGAINSTWQGVSATFESINGGMAVPEQNSQLDLSYSNENMDISKGFAWHNDRKLNLTARNIWVTDIFPTSGIKNSNFNITAVGTPATLTSDFILGEICFVKKYEQQNKGINTFTADGGNIIFKNGLLIGDKSTAIINCENLFVEGDITLTSANSRLFINAKNIVVTGSITVGSGTKIYSNCENVWIGGIITTKSEGSTIDFNDESDSEYATHTWNKNYNLNYFNGNDVSLENRTKLTIKGSTGNNQIIIGNITTQSSQSALNILNVNNLKTGNISLGHATQLTITGTTGKTNNQMISGIIKPSNFGGDNAHTVKITNFASFTCTGFQLDQATSLELKSESIVINGAFTLDRLISPMEITTQYFDCSGLTSISYLQKPLNFNASTSEPLNIRFAGGYKQFNSIVYVNNANMVVFGTQFELKADQPSELNLMVSANDIYLDNNDIYFQQYYNVGVSEFHYTNKNYTTTNLHIKTPVNWVLLDKTYTIKAGDYNAVNGRFPKTGDSFLYSITPESYHAPEWKNPPIIPSGSGSTKVSVTDGSVVMSNDSEKYY